MKKEKLKAKGEEQENPAFFTFHFSLFTLPSADGEPDGKK